jgi:hypothetical protein
MTEPGTLVEILGAAIGTGLTLLVFSYMLGDNPLYRLALHIFLGVLIGYSFGVAVRDVLVAKVLYPLSEGAWEVFVPLILGILLLAKGVRRQAYVGNMATGFLVGVGTAVALSGALLGTLIPQVAATGDALAVGGADLSRADGWWTIGQGALIVLGTLCTLMTFSFAAHKRHGLGGLWSRMVALAGGVGRLFLTSALAVAFASALTSALSLLAERWYRIIDYLAGLLTSP